jgi:hypothetical protein
VTTHVQKSLPFVYIFLTFYKYKMKLVTIGNKLANIRKELEEGKNRIRGYLTQQGSLQRFKTNRNLNMQNLSVLIKGP